MLITYATISIVLTICYLIIIGRYIYYWMGLDNWEYPPNYVPKTQLAVIVAARNEEKNIAVCLEALLQQDYPLDLLEIWVVDDHSEDGTVDIINKYKSSHLNLIQLSEGVVGKKQAIAEAIKQSTGELIVTTDADCIMNARWLKYIASYYEHNQSKFIAAPVSFYQEKTIFERFQTLDFMGMMAVSGAGIAGRFMNMCNGANLAYERTAYEEVNGFEGIDHVASGDDMLLMQKIAMKYPDKIGYIKHPDCQTFTHAKSTLKGFIQQRIRWTSKSGAYTGWQVLFILATVWLLCLTMLLDFILMPWNTSLMFLFVMKFLLKGIADFFFLRMMARFFGRPQLMRYFLPALLMHWWYIAIVGTLGNFAKNYQWKGRMTK